MKKLIPKYEDKKRYKVEGRYDSENKIMYFNLNSAVVSTFRRSEREY